MADLRILSTGHDLMVRARDENGARVVSIGGEADLQTEHRLSRALRDAVPTHGTPLVIDLTDLRFCSAYAMGVLVDITGSTVHRGINVALVGLPPVTARVWLLTEVPVPVQYASVELAVAALTGPAAQLEGEPDTVRLVAEVAGLRRALATRAIIEQAKGMLMERLTCTSEEAFNLIVLQSQQSSRRLHDIASEYVQSGAGNAAGNGLSRLADRRVGKAPDAPDPEPAA